MDIWNQILQRNSKFQKKIYPQKFKNCQKIFKFSLYKCGEMPALEKKEISPTFNQIDRVNGLPKIHRSY